MTVLLPVLCSVILNAAPPPEAERPKESLRTATAVFAVAFTADMITTAAFVARGGHEKNPMLAPLQDEPVLMLTVAAATATAGVWAWNRYVGRKHPKIAKVGLYAAAGVEFFVAARNWHLHTERRRVADSWKPRGGSFSIGYSASWE